MTSPSEVPLEPILIRIVPTPGSNAVPEVSGFLVPGTNGLLGIDMRSAAEGEYPEIWVVTHLPTGLEILSPVDTRANSKEHALRFAQGFFREWSRRGWDLSSTDKTQLVTAYVKLTRMEALRFWDQVYS